MVRRSHSGHYRTSYGNYCRCDFCNLIRAQSGGTVADDGGETITAKGVCWSTSQNPTTSDFKTVNSFVEILGSNPFSGSDQINADAPGSSFISNITGLNPGTAYYVRAYATNSLGTSYGTQKSFTTLAVAPTVTTTAISGITSNGASSGGNVPRRRCAVTVRAFAGEHLKSDNFRQ